MVQDQTRQVSDHRLAALEAYDLLSAHEACWFLARLESEGTEKTSELALLKLLELLQDKSREKLSLR